MASVTTKKDGFREVNGLDSDHFSHAVNPEGHAVWTATDDAGLVQIGWAKDDTQSHGTDPLKPSQPPLKTGSTVEEWVDANGIHHAVITRIK